MIGTEKEEGERDNNGDKGKKEEEIGAEEQKRKKDE